MLMALLLVALASSSATAGDAPGVDGQSSPPECTAVPGSSGYMRCVYGSARPSVAAAPTRRRTLIELRRSEAAGKLQASGAAGAIDMVRTIAGAQGAR
jgi:hypothetical protein